MVVLDSVDVPDVLCAPAGHKKSGGGTRDETQKSAWLASAKNRMGSVGWPLQRFATCRRPVPSWAGAPAPIASCKKFQKGATGFKIQRRDGFSLLGRGL